MVKKTLATLGVAAALVLTGSSAASAVDGYPVAPQGCQASPSTIRVGETSVITCTWDDTSLDGHTVTFSTSGPAVRAGTLSAARFAAGAGTSSVDKTIRGDSVSVEFTGPASRVYAIAVQWGADASATVELPITVVDEDGALAVTGGDAPLTALWIGVGVLALGGVAVGVSAVRRRAR